MSAAPTPCVRPSPSSATPTCHCATTSRVRRSRDSISAWRRRTRVVDLTGRLDLGYFHPVHILVDGTYVKNIAFDRESIDAIAFNNLDATNNGTLFFNGGDTGAMGRVLVGHPKLQQSWDWNAYVAYKYIESDATVDAFNDPDFGLGGTNLQGYIVGANLGINKYVWSSVKWMSATSIAGPRFAVDVFQLDLNARFRHAPVRHRDGSGGLADALGRACAGPIGAGASCAAHCVRSRRSSAPRRISGWRCKPRPPRPSGKKSG